MVDHADLMNRKKGFVTSFRAYEVQRVGNFV